MKAGRTQMRREKGNYPATVNEDGWPRLFRRLAVENGFTADDVDQVLYTQVSKPSIVIAAERCGVPKEVPYHHGEIWLYRLFLYSGGIGRRHRIRQDQTRGSRCDDQFGTWIQSGRDGDSYDQLTLSPYAMSERARGAKWHLAIDLDAHKWPH
jgi:hypothetical protein